MLTVLAAVREARTEMASVPLECRMVGVPTRAWPVGAPPLLLRAALLFAAGLPLCSTAGLPCWRAPSFGMLPARERAAGVPAAEGGGLAPLPATGRWGADPWALNASTAVFFVGNSTRMETPAEYQSDARWGVLGYSWNVNNIGSGDRHAERWESEEAEAIRMDNPNVKVMVTREVQVIGEWYDSIDLTNQTLIDEQWFIMCPSNESRTDDNPAAATSSMPVSPCVSKWSNNGLAPPRVTEGRWLNWSHPPAADWWVETFLGAALRNPLLDGVFLDTGPGAPADSVGISAASAAAACHQMAVDGQAAFRRAVKLAQSLGKFVTTQGAVYGAVTIAPWQSTGREPKMCGAGGLAGCREMAPITVAACTNASRRVLQLAQTLDATNHTFQLFSQGGGWWDFPGPPPRGRGSIDNVTANPVSFAAQIALFQIARGRSALLQWHDWSFTPTRRYIWSPDLDLDYGRPLEQGKEVSEGVFQRQWSERTVTLNCSSFVEALQLHAAAAGQERLENDDDSAANPKN